MLVLRSLSPTDSPTDSPFGTVDCMLSCECLKFTMGRMRIMLFLSFSNHADASLAHTSNHANLCEKPAALLLPSGPIHRIVV